MSQSRLNPIIYTFFFISGATSLLYEIIWFKLIQYLFGSTTYSVTTILAVFMGGLAVGSYLIGKLLDDRKPLLLIYGLLELFVGIYALIFLIVFQFIKSVYLSFGSTTNHLGWSLLIRVLLSFLALAPPTIAMGGTLPVLSQFLVKNARASAKTIGFLYTFNTLGAFSGSLFASLYLIETFAIHNCLILGGIINLLIGVLSIVFSGTLFSHINDGQKKIDKTNIIKQDSAPCLFNFRILIVYAISGAVALSYEIIFTRLFSLVSLNTVYTFAIMLSAFLAGIALGTFVISFFADRIQKKCSTIAFLQIILALFSFLIMQLFEPLSRFSYAIDERYFGHWNAIVFCKFTLFFLVQLPITLIFGALFPLFTKIIVRSILTISKELGTLYCYNTAGAICGSLICGFILVPFLGIAHAFFLLIAINLLIAGYLFFIEPPFAKIKYMWLLVVCLPYLLMPYIKDPSFLISRNKLSGKDKLLFFKEGIDSAVMITFNKEDNSKLLYQNNEWVANTKASGHKIFGHLPAFLLPKAEKILIVGLGSGISANSAALHSAVRQVDIVEISPTVLEASGYFQKENNDILNNSKTHFYLDDVRHFLQKTKNTYDVIAHEPLQQWTAGTVNLYTQEYYAICKSHLNQNGIISQWVQLNTLSVTDLKMIIKTFISVFPNASGWLVGKELYLAGFNGNFKPDIHTLISNVNSDHHAWMDLKNDPFNSPYQLTTESDLFALFLMDNQELTELSSDGSLILDDKPVMEYSVARSIATVSTTAALHYLLSHKLCSHLPENFIIPDTQWQSKWQNICQSRLLLYQGIVSVEDGNEHQALEYMKKSYELRPDDKTNQKTLASLLMKQGIELIKTAKNDKTAFEKFTLARSYCPDCYDILIKYGESLQRSGNYSDAKNYYLQAINTRPKLPEAYNHLAILYAPYDFNISYRMFLNAISLARYNQEYYFNVGLLCYKYHHNSEAKKYLALALRIDDESKLAPDIKRNLAMLDQLNMK